MRIKLAAHPWQNADRILNIAGIAEKKLAQGQLAMVLSAPAKITNYL